MAKTSSFFVVLALIAASNFLSVVLIPIALAILIYWLCDPIVDRLISKGWPRGLSAWFVTGSFFLTGLVALGITFFSVSTVVQEIPEYSSQFKSVIQEYEKETKKLEIGNDTTSDQIQDVRVVENPIQKSSAFVLRGLGSLVSAVAIGIFVPFVVLFLLLESPHFKTCVGEILSGGRKKKVFQHLKEMTKAYAFGNLSIGIALAIVQSGLFFALGLKNAWALGFVTGFLNLIPFAGMVLATLLPLAQALIQGHGILAPLMIAGVVVSLHLIVANWIVPRVLGGKVDLNATSSIIALLYWGWTWGAVGFLIAVPMTGALKIILESSESTASFAKLLGKSRSVA